MIKYHHADTVFCVSHRYLETDSVAYQYLTGRELFAAGIFYGDYLVLPHYLPKVCGTNTEA